MSITKVDVAIANATWVNLYAATGITVGNPIRVINKGSNVVEVAYSVAAPTTIRGTPLYIGAETLPLDVPTGEVGCWAYCPQGTTKLSVQDFVAEQVTLGASELNVGVTSGKLARTTATFSRPANATPYAALAVVGPAVAALLDFAGAARIVGAGGYIAKARLMTNQSTNTARFRLHLYHTAPAVIADGAQMTMLWANAANRIGYIDFPACGTEGTGSDAAGALNIVDHPAFVSGATTGLFGVLETRDAFTPSSGQQFHIQLTVEQY